MAKRKIRTITDEVVEVREKNPLGKMIKDFFDTGETTPEIMEANLSIFVQRFNPKIGKFETLCGTKYSDLEGMIQSLGQRYGSQRYKLYITAKDPQENKNICSVIIEDFALAWDSDEQPDELLDQEVNTVDSELELRRMDHEKEMKKLELQNQLMIAMMNQKGGGGMKMQDFLEVFNTAYALGSGRELPTGDNGSSDPLSGFANSSAGQMLISTLLQNFLTKKPSPELPTPSQVSPIS